jgi:hypothetical protein
VEIVRVADLVSQMHGVRAGGEAPRIALAEQDKYEELLDSCAPSLTEEERALWAQTLKVEFPNIIRSLQMQVCAGQEGDIFQCPGIWE